MLIRVNRHILAQSTDEKRQHFLEKSHKEIHLPRNCKNAKARWTTCANCVFMCFLMCFQNIVFTILVTDEQIDEQTDGQTDRCKT